MYSLISKIFAGLTAFLWADKKRLFLGLFASFWAIQQTACTYGCSGQCPEETCDPALRCSPVYDSSNSGSEPTSYMCKNGETVSVEEGKRRNKECIDSVYEFEQY